MSNASQYMQTGEVIEAEAGNANGNLQRTAHGPVVGCDA